MVLVSVNDTYCGRDIRGCLERWWQSRTTGQLAVTAVWLIKLGGWLVTLGNLTHY